MSAPEWLASKARSYYADARRLEGLDLPADGMSGREWAIVYRAVAEELRNCATSIGVAPDA